MGSDILGLISKHGLLLQTTAAALGKSPKVLQRLVLRGLAVRRTLRGRLCYYQLTKKGCAALGLSEARSRRFGPQALARRLSLLVWCLHGETRRYLRNRVGLEKQLECELPVGTYAAENAKQGTRTWFLHVAGPTTSVRTICRKASAKWIAANQVSGLREKIDTGQFRVAVLCLPEQVEGVKRRLKRMGLPQISVQPSCGWDVQRYLQNVRRATSKPKNAG